MLSDELLFHASNKTLIGDGSEINYGFGIMVTDSGLYHHGGSWGGYKSYFVLDCKSKSFVCILSNNAYPFVSSLAGIIMSNLPAYR